MGCLCCKLNVGVSLFPIGGPPISYATASSSKPHASTASGRRHPVRAHTPVDPFRRPRSTTTFIPGGGFPAHWPTWLSVAAGDALAGWAPRRAGSFQKLEKIGSGTYSNVYKARDLVTGRVVALKKVRVESVESAESVRFMVREIALLRRLDHPNVVRLQGLVASRVPCSPSLYLVFEYMDHDLSGLNSLSGVRFTLAQVKCYMKQLLAGLEYCHSQGVLHRDIKCANLLINQEGILKIADFGLATSFDPRNARPMTNQVVTLWYRPPELLLGAVHYGVGVDLWSAGCILAELLTGKPIFPGRTEVEQLHRIFKLCGSPSAEYFEKLSLMGTTSFKPYKRSISEVFSDLPPSSVSLIDKLLSLDPVDRGSATSALDSEFFKTEPYPCDPSSLPQYPPTKEMDRNLRKDNVGRQQSLNSNENVDPTNRIRLRNASCRGPGASQAELDRRRLVSSASTRSRTDRFPPPHLDAAIGISIERPHNDAESIATADELFMSLVVSPHKNTSVVTAGSVEYLGRSFSRKKNGGMKDHQVALMTDLSKDTRAHKDKSRESSVAAAASAMK